MAELAKPDSMGDLDQDDDETEEGDKSEQMKNIDDDEDDEHKETDNAGEERTSLLTEEQKEKSSPSIQLAAAGSGETHHTHANSGIKVSNVFISYVHKQQYFLSFLFSIHDV